MGTLLLSLLSLVTQNLLVHITDLILLQKIAFRQPEHIWTSDKPQKQSTAKAAIPA